MFDSEVPEKTHATNKKAHGNYRKRFSFLLWHVRNFPDFQITKKSENAFLYVFEYFYSICFFFTFNTAKIMEFFEKTKLFEK